MTGLSVERFRAIEQLDELGDEWDDLVRASSRSSPFLLRGWLVPWWRELAGGAELQVLVARNDGRLVAALPLCVRRRAGISIAGFVGGAYAEIADLLVAEGVDSAAARGLLAALDADVLHVFGLPAQSELARALAPRSPHLVVRAEAPVVSLDADWDSVYRSKLSPQRRKLHRKRLRRLEEAGRVELRTARAPAALESALEESFRLHELRWRGLPDRSGFTTEPGKRFHRAALARLAASGVPRIAVLALDGRAIASYYYLLAGGRACAASMAYDPAFARFSPGWLATLQALESAAVDGAREFELLGGLEEYKVALADRFAPLHEAVAQPRTAAASLYSALTLGRLRARRALKAAEPVRRAYYGAFAARRRLRRPSHAVTEA